MTQKCEVCENWRPDSDADPRQKFVEVDFGTRRVTLCTGHAHIAERSGVASFEQLRAFYGNGRRSFVARRGREPASPGSERRQRAGRRSTDVVR